MTDDWLVRVVEELRRPPAPAPDFDGRWRAAVVRPPARRTGPLLAGAVAAAVLVTAWAVRTRTASAAPVEFLIDAPAARAVTLVGDFNDWDRRRTPLERVAGTTRWRTRVPLPGGFYRYVFLVDGQRWVADSAQPTTEDPDFGTAVSMVTVR